MSTPNTNCNCGASKSNEMNDQGQNDIRKDTNTDKQPPPEFKPFKFGNHDEKNSSFGWV